MPVFSYRCEKCGENFDLLEGMTAEKAKKECPFCGSRRVEKTIAAFSTGSSSGKDNLPSASSCPTGTCPL